MTTSAGRGCMPKHRVGRRSKPRENKPTSIEDERASVRDERRTGSRTAWLKKKRRRSIAWRAGAGIVTGLLIAGVLTGTPLFRGNEEANGTGDGGPGRTA